MLTHVWHDGAHVTWLAALPDRPSPLMPPCPPPLPPPDFGLAEELTPAVRHHFISFLHMISRGERGGMRRMVGRLPGCVCVCAWDALPPVVLQ